MGTQYEISRKKTMLNQYFDKKKTMLNQHFDKKKFKQKQY